MYRRFQQLYQPPWPNWSHRIHSTRQLHRFFSSAYKTISRLTICWDIKQVSGNFKDCSRTKYMPITTELTPISTGGQFFGEDHSSVLRSSCCLFHPAPTPPTPPFLWIILASVTWKNGHSLNPDWKFPTSGWFSLNRWNVHKPSAKHLWCFGASQRLPLEKWEWVTTHSDFIWHKCAV